MRNYICVVGCLNFIVSFLLLLVTCRLMAGVPKYWKMTVAAILSGIYAGACLLPRMYFLGNVFWRLVSLMIISAVAFGLDLMAVRKGVLYALFSMALSGCMLAIGDRSIWSVVPAGIVILLLCAVGVRCMPGMGQYVPIELHYGDQKISLTALRDTGNTLRDPISGQPVLVISPEAAVRLTGLTKDQLRRPLDAILEKPVPGLRLIPYHSIGNAGGMLLALRLANVRIGEWKGSSLVAFAPDGLGSDEQYQALTGGIA